MLELHEGRFAGWSLRWLYLLVSFLGCAMIATGLVFWTSKRKVKLRFLPHIASLWAPTRLRKDDEQAPSHLRQSASAGFVIWAFTARQLRTVWIATLASTAVLALLPMWFEELA